MWKVMGVIGLLMATAVGGYLGVWVCFVGGIIQAVHAFTQHDPVSASQLAYGIVRVWLSALVGWGTFMLIAAPSIALFELE